MQTKWTGRTYCSRQNDVDCLKSSENMYNKMFSYFLIILKKFWIWWKGSASKWSGFVNTVCIHLICLLGYTPIHHCLSMYGSEPTMALARLLLEKGADPNAKSRLGCVPLFECVQANNVDFVKLLLEFGVSIISSGLRVLLRSNPLLFGQFFTAPEMRFFIAYFLWKNEVFLRIL